MRSALEPDVHPFVTEPDIMLVAEDMLICIEAKFGSGNPLAYESPYRPGEKPTSLAGLLGRYLGDRTSERTRAIVRRERIGPKLRSQLFRNIVFASEMAGEAPGHVANLVSSTHRVGSEDKRKSHADPTEEIQSYLSSGSQDSFSFRTWEELHAALVKDDGHLAELNTYLHGKSAHYQRAFQLGY